MKWRCVLIQRWLPEYPDGELSPFWRRRLEAHLEACPECQAELAELQEAVEIYREHPLPEPEPGFWEAFDRELHLKLARINHQAPAEPERRRFKLPYLIGAPALAVLLIFLSTYLVNLQQPGKAPQLAERQKLEERLEAGREPRLEVAKERPTAPAELEVGRFRAADAEQVMKVHLKPPAENGLVPEQVIYVGLNDGLWQGEVPSWDVEAVVADLSHQERKVLVENLSSRR